MILRVGPKEPAERVLEVKLRAVTNQLVDVVVVGPGGTEQAIARVEAGADRCRLLLRRISPPAAEVLGLERDLQTRAHIATVKE